MEALKPQAKKCSQCGALLASIKQGGSTGCLLKKRFFVGRIYKEEPAATLYLGYDEERQQTVLIREFSGEGFVAPENTTARERLVERFVSYGKSMAAFSLCDLLPRTVDVFSESGKGYTVLEWFDGQSLKELLAAGIRISEGHALRITEQLCEGLKILHNSHMIYGALSPDTLYILKDGGLRLLGLGSPFFDFVTDLEQRTRVLNPSYAAPELFTQEPCGAYSDVYSVAAILDRIVTNVIPPVSFLRREGETLRSPRRENRVLERSLSVAILNAMNWEVAYRTKTVDRLLKEMPNAEVRRRLSPRIVWAFLLGRCGWIGEGVVAWAKKTLPKLGQKAAALWKRITTSKRFGRICLWVGLGLATVLVALLLIWWIGFGADTALLPGGNRVTSSDGWYYGTGKNDKDTASKQSFLEQFGVESERDDKRPTTSTGHTSSEPNDGKIACPDLIGYYKNFALSLVEDVGLEVGKITEEYSDEYSRGYIIGQGIQPGKRVEPGSPVSLVISKGSKPVSQPDAMGLIPNVMGNELLQATKALQEAGFTNVVYQFEQGTAEAGTVVGQNLPSDTSAAYDTEIVLTVVGRATTVPDYLGLTAEAAVAKNSDIQLQAIGINGLPLDLTAIDLQRFTVVKQSVVGGTEGYAEMWVKITLQSVDSIQ